MTRRVALAVAAALAFGCTQPPPPAPARKPDPTAAPWYAQATTELQTINREAEQLLKRGKRAEAAELITKGQAVSARLLEVPRPTLEAMIAVSDLDHLYARMLEDNRHFGWARMAYQKDAKRWEHWRPQTEETQRRKQMADEAVARVDRQLER